MEKRTLLILAVFLAGCGDDDIEKTNAERICDTVESCPNVTLRVSREDCVNQFEEKLEDVSMECADCIGNMNCNEIAAVLNDPANGCTLCPACTCDETPEVTCGAPGVEVICACEGGEIGVQYCQEDGTYTICECAEGSGGTGGTAGESGTGGFGGSGGTSGTGGSGGTGEECTVVCDLPNTDYHSCIGEVCSVDTCSWGYANCNDPTDPDGCELDIDANPRMCGDNGIGSIKGDTGAETLRYSSTGGDWIYFEVTDEMAETDYLSADIRLDVPGSVNYDIYVSCGSGCDSVDLYGEEAGLGVDELVSIRWDDRPVAVDDRLVYVEIVYFDGSSCEPWSLEVTGNSMVFDVTCP